VVVVDRRLYFCFEIFRLEDVCSNEHGLELILTSDEDEDNREYFMFDGFCFASSSGITGTHDPELRPIPNHVNPLTPSDRLSKSLLNR